MAPRAREAARPWPQGAGRRGGASSVGGTKRIMEQTVVPGQDFSAQRYKVRDSGTPWPTPSEIR